MCEKNLNLNLMPGKTLPGDEWGKSEVYSESFQTSKIKHFAKMISGFEPLTFFAKRFILDV